MGEPDVFCTGELGAPPSALNSSQEPSAERVLHAAAVSHRTLVEEKTNTKIKQRSKHEDSL